MWVSQGNMSKYHTPDGKFAHSPAKSGEPMKWFFEYQSSCSLTNLGLHSVYFKVDSKVK